MDVEGARTIGARLRRIRNFRRKSLRVVADLAGMSKSRLSEIERGEAVLDRLSEIVALANALQIAPSELTRLPMPAPENGDADSAEDAVRLALLAVNHNQPGGQVVPVDVLRARVRALLDARCRCGRQAEAAAALPELIRDMYTSLAAGRDVAALLDLAVLLHTQGTVGWLWVVGASVDLRSQAATLAQQAARDRDTPTALGIATLGVPEAQDPQLQRGRLLDPADDSNIYVALQLQNLRLKDNRFDWFVPLATARRLRDQLTEHLDAV